MSGSIWRSGAILAFVGPLLGLTIVLGFVLASGATARTDMSLMDQLLAMLTFAPMLLIGAYVVGAPGAFAVGVTIELLSRRAVPKLGTVAASVLLGAAISLLMITGLDEFVLPHPHGDATPLLGLQTRLAIAGVGALSAAICVSFFLWRFHGRRACAALIVPEGFER
jgi:hypothetical protein